MLLKCTAIYDSLTKSRKNRPQWCHHWVVFRWNTNFIVCRTFSNILEITSLNFIVCACIMQFWGTTSEGDDGRAGAKISILAMNFKFLLIYRPVLDLLTGQKSGFSPRRGDTLHRFRSNFAGPTGTWVRLALQNFTSICGEEWECSPQNIKNFHFLVKSRPAGATPLTYFEIF